ncbi:hypothetical protein DS909_09575 [Phaeobacter gallaeciensis]|uniref:DUF1254 domain-containing protein n=2 Tax=Roseobacteraceae TaxID=2854170 RepID=A0A366WZH8_9RHOB|nr:MULTISPECIES: DUF1254 domain-containing protein [Roseobacteraceae]MBT3141038.1 DUF1254 domain-containing protein [Falsiruegeria litorea]MBT8168071.1 DUF1254 domain-containing protein [Falsiruegeria litorea]RBW56116.1 hypothetical protein DS909_09575 [Phaeobacter gallaeciensis]
MKLTAVSAATLSIIIALTSPATPTQPVELGETELRDFFERSYQYVAMLNVNNDTLYAGAMVDVTEGPMVMTFHAFYSVYASLMVTGYDHYVNIPLSKVAGDIAKPTSILFYSD